MPSKPKAAKISAVGIPKGIVNNSHSDSVRWTAFGERGEEVGKWDRSACYSGIMTQLGSYEIHCRPYWNRLGRYSYSSSGPKRAEEKAADAEARDQATCLLPGSLYKAFWRHCKETGLVPEETETFVQNKQNRLVVPRRGWDRHTVYAILSLYRHCDCQPRMPAMAVLLHRKLRKQGVHFLQCLHYAMADLGHSNPGHVFIVMDDGSAPYGYYGNCGGRNLAAGLALARFARMPLEERKALGDGRTYEMFCKLAQDLNPIQKAKRDRISSCYSAPAREGTGRPQYLLKGKESVLLPKFGPLYENPNLTAKEFAEAMKGECE